MAFFNEFPHTHTYDTDLAWLIKRMKEVLSRMDSVEDRMTALENLVNNFIESLNLPEVIRNLLREMIDNSELLTGEVFFAQGDIQTHTGANMFNYIFSIMNPTTLTVWVGRDRNYIPAYMQSGSGGPMRGIPIDDWLAKVGDYYAINETNFIDLSANTTSGYNNITNGVPFTTSLDSSTSSQQIDLGNLYLRQRENTGNTFKPDVWSPALYLYYYQIRGVSDISTPTPCTKVCTIAVKKSTIVTP